MCKPPLKLPALLLWLVAMGIAGSASGAQIGPPKFDHLTTGFELLNAHLNIPCESCHVGAVFKGTPRDCASCHNRGARITATFKPESHVLSSDRCDACHTDVAWNPASQFNHQEVEGGCANCHNGVIATGKPANHIAAPNTCDSCHSVFGWLPVVKFDHSQISGGCSTCHNGAIAAGLPANHFPTSEDCGVCHLSTAAFGPGTAMNHQGITSNCASCHETGMAWVGVTMVDRPTAAQDANHPTTGDCSQCHTSTVSFTLGVNAKPANHIPTAQPCTLCHTNPKDYSVYTMNHAGITNNCIQCHGAGLSFANIVPKEPPSNHIPTGSIACEGCHSPSVFTTFSGTKMNHTPVAALACDSCHETGMSWYGVKIEDRPRGHHTGQDCKVCHNTNNWDNAKGGSVSPGPTARITAQSINTAGLLGPAPAGRAQASVHAGNGGRCASCHDGTSASGKGGAHIQSNDSCDNCHTTIAWIPARFEHQGVAQPCLSCHDAVHSTGKPANHVATALACGTCHAAIAWMPVIYPHTGIVGSCQSCHNGSGASGKSVGHWVTAMDCASCHDTSTWFAAAHRHTGAAYPGDHAADLSCVNCHTGNTQQVPWRYPAAAPSCAGCHERNYQPAPHVRYGNVRYTAAELENCAGACHVYSDSTLKTITKFRPGPQHRVSSGQF